MHSYTQNPEDSERLQACLKLHRCQAMQTSITII